MIFTLLYSSHILVENKYRNTYLYFIGSILYVVIHWLLFSSIGTKYALIQKYKNIFYAIVVCDMTYIGYRYKMYKKISEEEQEKNKQKASPVIEQINEEQKQQKTNTNTTIKETVSQNNKESEITNTEKQCDGDTCTKDINNSVPHDVKTNSEHEVNSIASIPIYVPSNDNLPVYAPDKVNYD